MVEELYEKQYAPLLRWCVAMTGERAAAEDVVQETFLRALRSLDSLEDLGEAQRRAWLYRTARNLWIDGVRRAARAPEPETAPLWEDDQSRVAVAALCAQLPEAERALFELRYFAGYNATELGEAFGLPPSTVRARLAAAKKRLRALYASE